MKDIIGYDNYLYDRTIDTHIKNLRKKLEGAIEIETIRGVGYRVK
jgi:DNA-binding response OmpR family regulator